MKATDAPSATGKTVHRINPLGMRVVVRIPKEDSRSEGGLFLPPGAKEAQEESILAEVIEVASAHDEMTDEDTNISGIPLNAWVLISKSAGICVPWNDALRIVETLDVLAIVEHVTVS
jgi:co-chaperonin GroES (HSP10)